MAENSTLFPVGAEDQDTLTEVLDSIDTNLTYDSSTFFDPQSSSGLDTGSLPSLAPPFSTADVWSQPKVQATFDDSAPPASESKVADTSLRERASASAPPLPSLPPPRSVPAGANAPKPSPSLSPALDRLARNPDVRRAIQTIVSKTLNAQKYDALPPITKENPFKILATSCPVGYKSVTQEAAMSLMDLYNITMTNAPVIYRLDPDETDSFRQVQVCLPNTSTNLPSSASRQNTFLSLVKLFDGTKDSSQMITFLKDVQNATTETSCTELKTAKWGAKWNAALGQCVPFPKPSQ